MSRDLVPTAGARFLLELELDAGARATYRATIFTPDATHVGRATLGDDGSVELAAGGAPDDLAQALQQLAKLTARGAARRREDGLPPWPPRVLRWRGPGRGE